MVVVEKGGERGGVLSHHEYLVLIFRKYFQVLVFIVGVIVLSYNVPGIQHTVVSRHLVQVLDPGYDYYSVPEIIKACGGWGRGGQLVGAVCYWERNAC